MKLYLRFNIFYLVLLALGVPNFFVVYDATNIFETSGFDINMILRLGVFLLAGLIIIFTHQLSRTGLVICLVPLVFYILQLPNIFIQQSGADLLKSFYRLIEYLIFFLFIISLFRYDEKFSKNDFYSFVEISWFYLLVTIVIGCLFFPEKILGVNELGQTYSRLGGSVIHPNTLGNLSAISFLYMFYISDSKWRKIYCSLAFTIVILTYSRGAMLALILAWLIPLFLTSKNKLLITALSFILFIIVTFFYGRYLIDFFSRGQGIEGLLTLSGRMIVWLSSIDLITSSVSNFIFGISFGEASEEIIGYIMDVKYGISYWKSPSAHNDYLQAWLGGGIIFFILTLIIQYKTLKLVSFLENKNERAFYYGSLLVFFLYSITMTSMNFNLNPFSAIFWLMYLSLNRSKKCDSF